MQITIDKIIYPGRSIAKPEGKIIFTDNGLPGETVEVEVIKEKKNYIDAKTLKILFPSAHRIQPRCAHHMVCSPYQHIDYPLQVEIKKAQIEEIFGHQLKIEPGALAFRASENIWRYRNKIQLRVVWKSGVPALAYNLPRSHDQYEPVDMCYLASVAVNGVLRLVTTAIADNKLECVREVAVRENADTTELLVEFYCHSIKNVEYLSETIGALHAALLDRFPVRGIVCIERKTSRRLFVRGEDSINESVAGKIFCIGPGSFFQINVPMLERLIDDLKASILPGPDTIIADLYCGIGTFGVILAPHVRKVIGVESSKESVVFLKRNLERNNTKNFSILKGDCKKKIAGALKGPVDTVIVDPPRRGLDAEVTAGILKSLPPLVAYISCDPATLVRDLKTLLPAYTLKHLYAYDFFPQTPHIETLTVLQKKSHSA